MGIDKSERMQLMIELITINAKINQRREQLTPLFYYYFRSNIFIKLYLQAINKNDILIVILHYSYDFFMGYFLFI